MTTFNHTLLFYANLKAIPYSLLQLEENLEHGIVLTKHAIVLETYVIEATILVIFAKKSTDVSYHEKCHGP
jgi:hypothetical protein